MFNHRRLQLVFYNRRSSDVRDKESMSEVIMIVSPGKWVSEEQLIALKGIKKGTLKKAREKSFMEGNISMSLMTVCHGITVHAFTTWKKLIAGLSARHLQDQDVILLD
ncbi:putative excisionase [Escherichia coli]|nr:putative excisionase [Escherichia coli]